MSEDAGRWQFLTRAKLIAGTVGAVIVAGGAYLGACSGAARLFETPQKFAVHDSIASERMTEFERRLSQSRLVICEMLGYFPSECPQFTIEHEDVP